MAATARAFLLSRFNDVALKCPLPPLHLHRSNLLLRPLLPATVIKRRSSSPVVLNCLISGVDGGGVADDFVSIRKSEFDREFSVISSMLKRIEPLDTSVISKGVSTAARDSMKRTISTMLGLLPSDQYSVTIRVAREPLDNLLVSSIITGYTLWNAEYRLSLMRNFDISPDSCGASEFSQECEVLEEECEEREGGVGDGCGEEDGGRRIPQSIGDLSPETLSYIRELEFELATIAKELNAQKQENMRLECEREENNDLLEYLRSLESDMVTELSQPSSSEVDEIIHHLVRNVLKQLFKDNTASGFLEDSVNVKTEDCPDGDVELWNTIGTSRDYLAKLLFWCMLLGHHLRGLENRLHLSCVVGLL